MKVISTRTFISRAGSFEKHERDNFPAFFVDNATGKGILMCHADEHGSLAPASRTWLDRFNDRIDLIFCCHPKRVRANTGDERVQGYYDSETEAAYSIVKATGQVVITFRAVKR